MCYVQNFGLEASLVYREQQNVQPFGSSMAEK